MHAFHWIMVISISYGITIVTHRFNYMFSEMCGIICGLIIMLIVIVIFMEDVYKTYQMKILRKI